MIQKSDASLRLFAGIAATHEINARLEALIDRLKPLARIRWSPPANFHITTKFIGAWPQHRLHELKAALSNLSGYGRFRIAIRGLGFFPHARAPRVFWTGVDGGERLVGLAARTDQACGTLGIEPERKSYSPHLTLARVNAPSDLGALHQSIANLPSTEFGEFEASAFSLYLSRPSPGGSVYTSLAEYPL